MGVPHLGDGRRWTHCYVASAARSGVSTIWLVVEGRDVFVLATDLWMVGEAS